MKWKATHILKENGDAPRRVMLNSGDFFTKREWEEQVSAHWMISTDGDGRPLHDNVAFAIDMPSGLQNPTRTATYRAVGEAVGGTAATSMRKAVSRITTDFKVKIAGKWRRLIVTMGPGDVLTMRPEGCRSSSARTFDYGSAWGLAGKQQARKIVRERKEARKAKREAA